MAVLPVSCDEKTPETVEGRNTLEPVLQGEFAKLTQFEVHPVPPEVLVAKTGQKTWGCDEALPHDLLVWLKQACGCDAVLFCKLTAFRGYSPMLVGWSLRLVDIQTGSTIWAVEDVFDSTVPSVRAGAHQYFAQTQGSWVWTTDDWLIQNSPRCFGQYAAAQVLTTLPGF